MTTMTDARAVEVLAAMREDGGVVEEADYVAAIDHAIARLREPAEAQGGGEAVPIAWRTVYPDGSHSKWMDGAGHWPETKGFAGGAHGWEYAFAPPSAPDVAMEAWHSAVDNAAELRANAPDERYAKRAASVESWIKANRPAPPSAPVGVEGLPKPFGYVEPRHDLSGYEVFDEPGPRRAAIWNMHGMRKALAQTRAHYSIDADHDGIRERVADAITGALSFGAQGAHKPPAGHWLEQFWDMARAEREAPSPPTVGEATARRLDDYLGGEFDIRIGKQAAHAALVHALAKQPAACDMGELCIGCEPRNPDGSCPDQQPAAVDGAAVDRVAKAIADVIGHGMTEKCEAQARAAIAALAPKPEGGA